MNCLHCERPLPDGASFCPTCGTRVGQNAPPQIINVPSDGACSIGIIGGNDRISPTLSPIQFLFMIVISAIPFIGLIFQLMWLFKRGVNPSKKNFARAVLALKLMAVALSLVFSLMLIINAIY